MNTLKKICYYIGLFFKALKNYAVYILIGITAFFLAFNWNKLKAFILKIFKNSTDQLREKKDKNDNNKNYTATKIGEEDNSKIPTKRKDHKKAIENLIAKNRKYIEGKKK